MQLSLEDVLEFYAQQLHHRPYQPPSLATADLTLTDWFCGFGGGTIGAHQVRGARLLVTSAFNHNPTCIKVHSKNHPETEHGCVDITAFEASYFPGSQCAIFAPECKYHTTANSNAALRDWEERPQQQLALDFWADDEVTQKQRQSVWNKLSEKERQEALYRAERSRMTMGQVARMAAHHQYLWFIVENVVQVRRWRHFKAWVNEIRGLGYKMIPVYLNAAMGGVPQLRDRVFFFCYKSHLPTPNLQWRPLAWCPRCKSIGLSEQRWKKWQHDPIDPMHPGGKYGKHAQYLYHCCHCGEVTYPYARPAADIINWDIPCVPIGQRQEHKLPPLKETTRGRIGAGLKRYAGTHLLDTTYSQAGVSGKVKSLSEPLPAQTTRQSFALAIAPTLHSIGTHNAPIIQLSGHQHRHLTAFIATLRGKQPQNRPINAPISTLTTSGAHHGLTVLPQGNHRAGINSVNTNSAFMVGFYSRNNAHSDIHQPLHTLTPEPRFGVATLPAIQEMGGLREQIDKPSTPLLYTYHGAASLHPVGVPLTTQTTKERHALLVLPDGKALDLDHPPQLEEAIDACGFRMLTWEEARRGMGFPEVYQMTSNRRLNFHGIGQAISPACIQMIIEMALRSWGSAIG